ncbi:MAG: UPF0158 family protein [Armatimonadota bacterium]
METEADYLEPPLRKLPVDLETLAEFATEGEDYLDDSYARVGYFDTHTGAVHIVYRQALSCIEDELDPDELDEWGQADLQIAGEILSDRDGRYEAIDRWHSSEEFRLMEQFAEETTDPRARAALLSALSGRKPFRRFKEAVCDWPGLRDTWFLFRDHARRQRARRWLQQLEIDAEDASQRKLDPLPERW